MFTPYHIVFRAGTKVIWYSVKTNPIWTLHLRDRLSAASLRYRNLADSMCELKPYSAMFFRADLIGIRCRVNKA